MKIKIYLLIIAVSLFITSRIHIVHAQRALEDQDIRSHRNSIDYDYPTFGYLESTEESWKNIANKNLCGSGDENNDDNNNKSGDCIVAEKIEASFKDSRPFADCPDAYFADKAEPDFRIKMGDDDYLKIVNYSSGNALYVESKPLDGQPVNPPICELAEPGKFPTVELHRPQTIHEIWVGIQPNRNFSKQSLLFIMNKDIAINDLLSAPPSSRIPYRKVASSYDPTVVAANSELAGGGGNDEPSNPPDLKISDIRPEVRAKGLVFEVKFKDFAYTQGDYSALRLRAIPKYADGLQHQEEEIPSRNKTYSDSTENDTITDCVNIIFSEQGTTSDGYCTNRNENSTESRVITQTGKIVHERSVHLVLPFNAFPPGQTDIQVDFELSAYKDSIIYEYKYLKPFPFTVLNDSKTYLPALRSE